MANWKTGVVMGYMIGTEFMVAIADAMGSGDEGVSINYVPPEVASAAVVESQNVDTGVTVYVRKSSGTKGSGDIYPI